ncbi:MAG: DUF2520 domain-containing protein [Anaerolineae bacterium]|nr:DUF2520 domain-containing protein [Gemmatimonadaceae bacterium]
MSDRIFIMGAGRAGLGLARAFRVSGCDVVGVHGRRPRIDAGSTTTGELPDTLSGASVVLVAVRDAQLESALGELAEKVLGKGAVILQVSGSAEPRMFKVLQERGHPVGTFHPLVPLALPDLAPELLRGACIGIDGDSKARATAERLARAIGASTLEIPGGAKGLYHAAAVIASNFPAALLSLAERTFVSAGINRAQAHKAARSLFLASAANLRHELGVGVLTGPIARGDVATVQMHLEALAEQPELLAAYKTLSRTLLPFAREQGANLTDVEKISDLLD